MVRKPDLREPSAGELELVKVYRAQADSALGRAQSAPNPEFKDLYLKVAECWSALAKFETLAVGLKA